MSKIVSVIDVEEESGMYVAIPNVEYPLLLRGCTLVSPYRAGFEDCLYAQVYANPYRVGSVRWHQYDRGNEDARRQAKGVT